MAKAYAYSYAYIMVASQDNTYRDKQGNNFAIAQPNLKQWDLICRL